MAIPSTGAISLQTIENEFGGTGSISLSEYYRGGSYTTTNNTGVPTSSTISMSSFRGTVKQISITVSTDQKELNLSTLATANGWTGVEPVVLTINSGIYIWSDNTSIGALTIPSTFANKLTILNYGYIIGRGGNGGSAVYGTTPTAGGAGGPAIKNSASGVTLTNYSGAFIGGGGGGGGAGDGYGGGGGGAGGGTGGTGRSSSNNNVAGGAGGAIRAVGANSAAGGNNTTGQGGPNGGSGGGVNVNDGADSSSGGGGGGRIITNTNGVNAIIPTGNGSDWPAGYGGGRNQAGGAYGYPYWQSPTLIGGTGRGTTAAGGGGGYGQPGGAGGAKAGGAGGAAISGTHIAVTNSGGTILGAQA